ncbi:AI-2E family transporter [Aliidiomarina iranensis]|uniref:AI-2E family transporter n=1 Tax=Aliidiomarina iranensis TaxID=1434071 RepID=A0A432W1J9_9GAMM|nr:AI-2E family transporter [Aliidiomarina iranensis]RUO23101.1 AI-2E family transporter [Aliidiomarina iranensis]
MKKQERNLTDLATPIYGLFILAILYTFYLAHEVVLPMVLAMLVTLLLSPVVESLLKRFGIPKAISALVLLLTLIGGLVGVGAAMSGPLLEWAERAPSTVSQLFVGESEVQQRIERITSTAEQLEKQLNEEMGEEEQGTTQTVVLQTESWRSQLAEGAYQTAAGVLLALALTYFLLVSGDRMLLNLAAQLSREKRLIMMRIVRNGQEHVARYLGVITLTNIALGTAIGLIAWAVGLPTPVIWGVVVGLTRFIPYLGVMIAFGLLTIVSVASFDELWMIAIVPASFMVLTSLVGFFLEPYIHGMRLAVNPVIIFVAIFFWGWLWGPVGVFIAVPLMTVIMVIASHIPSMQGVYKVLSKAEQLSPHHRDNQNEEQSAEQKD